MSGGGVGGADRHGTHHSVSVDAASYHLWLSCQMPGGDKTVAQRGTSVVGVSSEEKTLELKAT